MERTIVQRHEKRWCWATLSSFQLSHSLTLPRKPAHSLQCFRYHPNAASTWLCLKPILASWVPAPDLEPVLAWCPLVSVPRAPWTQYGQPKLLLPEPVVTLSANEPTLFGLPKPETWWGVGRLILFSPSLPRSSWLARRMELPFHRNTISLPLLVFPSRGHWKSPLATTGSGLFPLGWVVSFKSPGLMYVKHCISKEQRRLWV